MKSNKSNNGIFNLISYIILMIVAILIVLRPLLPLFVEGGSDGLLVNILETIKEVLILVMIGIMSYNFIIGKGKTIVIFYWVAVAIFFGGIVLRWVL